MAGNDGTGEREDDDNDSNDEKFAGSTATQRGKFDLLSQKVFSEAGDKKRPLPARLRSCLMVL